MEKLILALIFPWQLHAFTLDSLFIPLEIESEQASFKVLTKDFKPKITQQIPPIVERVLKNPNAKVNSAFKIPDYFYPNTRFWFIVYTQLNSKKVLIHDKNNLSIIYEIVDFNELKNFSQNDFLTIPRQNQLAMERVLTIKKALNDLAAFLAPQNEQQKKLLTLIKKILPEQKSLWPKILNYLAQNIRIQTGQKDIIMAGLMASRPYQKFIYRALAGFELPKELFALSFLESSFNPYAESKVGAMGVWQFMPSVGRHYMHVNRHQDGRKEPLTSSLSAMHLTKENYRSLQRWDLAITAYNSGSSHLQKASKRLGKKTPTLQEIFQTYKSPHHGFASKNFYASFLALTYALSNKDKLSLGPSGRDIYFPHQIQDIELYISKCSFTPQKVFKHLPPYTRFLNRHFKKIKRRYPKGSILVSDQKLTNRRWYRPTLKQMRRNYPKNFKRLVRKMRCQSSSTK